MIFGINLPRRGGQALQEALAIATGQQFWHSVNSLSVLGPNDGGTVECWFPLAYLEEQFDKPRYIYLLRDEDEWLKSCQKMYPMSRRQNWNNPMWWYPPETWRHYAREYFLDRLRPRGCTSPMHEGRMLLWDLTSDPCWAPLCEFLGVPIPRVPFPNKDKFRPQGPQPTFGFENLWRV